MINDLIGQLKHEDAKVREGAATQLTKLARGHKLGLEDARQLIAAAAGEFPPAPDWWKHPAVLILYAVHDAAQDFDPGQLVPAIERVFASLPACGQMAALRIVTLSHTPEAARLYVRWVCTHVANLNGEHALLATFPPAAGPAVARVLFPDVLEAARAPEVAFEVFRMLLDFRNADALPADIAKRYHRSIANVTRAEVSRAISLQRPDGHGWKYEDPYSPHRAMVALLFDLAGALESASILDVLKESDTLVDPRLRRFRAVSLLRRGVEVPDEEFVRIAASPCDRYGLFGQLGQVGHPDRRPPACLDQALLAEGAMAEWLTFGTELGREPDEIELLRRVKRSHSSGPRVISWLRKRREVEYFFFKFRVTEEHWSQENGWMVGMAGGYEVEKQPTTQGDGGTFSTFAKLDAKSIDEHVREYLS